MGTTSLLITRLDSPSAKSCASETRHASRSRGPAARHDAYRLYSRYTCVFKLKIAYLPLLVTVARRGNLCRGHTPHMSAMNQKAVVDLAYTWTTDMHRLLRATGASIPCVLHMPSAIADAGPSAIAHGGAA